MSLNMKRHIMILQALKRHIISLSDIFFCKDQRIHIFFIRHMIFLNNILSFIFFDMLFNF